MKTVAKIVGIIAIIIVGGFILLQLVPYGRNHTNPAVIAEPNWSSPEVRAQFMQSCGDCHSNETKWPWYSNIAPVSWLVAHDVEEGRSRLNVSEWGTRRNEADEAAELVMEGEMPMPIYLAMHPTARLDMAKKQALISGLQQTFGGEAGSGEYEGDD
jgi:hypothetical protein